PVAGELVHEVHVARPAHVEDDPAPVAGGGETHHDVHLVVFGKRERIGKLDPKGVVEPPAGRRQLEILRGRSPAAQAGIARSIVELPGRRVQGTRRVRHHADLPRHDVGRVHVRPPAVVQGVHIVVGHHGPPRRLVRPLAPRRPRRDSARPLPAGARAAPRHRHDGRRADQARGNSRHLASPGTPIAAGPRKYRARARGGGPTPTAPGRAAEGRLTRTWLYQIQLSNAGAPPAPPPHVGEISTCVQPASLGYRTPVAFTVNTPSTHARTVPA